MKKIQRKHEAHRLTYAIANDGRLVNIDTVKTGQECCCICPACKEPLVAKNKGTVRVFIIFRISLAQNVILHTNQCCIFLPKSACKAHS